MPESVNGENRGSGRPSKKEAPSLWDNVSVPHPTKLLFPEVGLRRIDIVAYYDVVSSAMLPHLKGRALTLIRWPHGIEGPRFYQRHPTAEAPLIISNKTDLLGWVARGALEFHAPLGPLGNPLIHDWAVMDLDPAPEMAWDQVREAGELVADFFTLCDIPFGAKTSGKHGLHFFIRIVPTTQRLTVYWIRSLATLLTGEFPDLFTIERLKNRRGARIYLDYLQNSGTRTMAAIFSLRATPMASASTPVTMKELKYPPEHWTPQYIMANWQGLTEAWPACVEPIDLGRILKDRNLLLPAPE